MRADYGVSAEPVVTLTLGVDELEMLFNLAYAGRVAHIQYDRTDEIDPETMLVAMLRGIWDEVRRRGLDRHERRVYAQ